MSTYAVVDSGTTTTRLRLWSDGTVVWTASRPAGARDTAVTGSNDRIREALRDLLEQARKADAGSLDAIICSGMITSNMGLLEVPHLPAPASQDALARNIVQHTFPDLDELPLAFIPGVKTLPRPLELGTLASGDVLRGEEAEIAGLRQAAGSDRPTTYLHIGSHHKAIDVDATGVILASRSAITGELLAAVAKETILKSSIVPLQDLQVDVEAAVAGAEATIAHGLGRALFLVRVGEQLGEMPEARMTSYLLGALAALDLPLLDSGDRAPADVVVYGTGAFVEILAAVLDAKHDASVTVVDHETAQHAAVTGAVLLFELGRRLGVTR